MRVPPDQSMTLAEHAASASSGSLCLERAGDVGEPRAEQEGVHALSRIRHRMQEMQEQPRVFAIEPEMSSSATIGGCRSSRPRYLRSISAPPAFMLARKRAAHVDDVAVPVGREAARLHLVEREHHAA